MMNAVAVFLVSLSIILTGAFCGAALRKALPERHLADETKDVVRLGTGLVGTIAALVLGLLIASANSSFDAQRGHVRHLAADLILLDQLLAEYGPETRPIRQELRQIVDQLVERIWWEQTTTANRLPFDANKTAQAMFASIAQLAPQNEVQRAMKDRAIAASTDLAQTRLLLFEQAGAGIPLPFLVVLVFWLAIIFASFGLFSRLNPVLVAALSLFALSASGALYLVLELSQPFTGLMQISSDPLRSALAPL